MKVILMIRSTLYSLLFRLLPSLCSAISVVEIGISNNNQYDDNDMFYLLLQPDPGWVSVQRLTIFPSLLHLLFSSSSPSCCLARVWLACRTSASFLPVCSSVVRVLQLRPASSWAASLMLSWDASVCTLAIGNMQLLFISYNNATNMSSYSLAWICAVFWQVKILHC